MNLHLGFRRVQKINGVCFLSLPKVWIQSHDIEKGEALSVTLLEDGTLKISQEMVKT